jgi:hypothetical protein
MGFQFVRALANQSPTYLVVTVEVVDARVRKVARHLARDILCVRRQQVFVPEKKTQRCDIGYKAHYTSFVTAAQRA